MRNSVISDPSKYCLDPNDPHNETGRIGNHYTNDESRLTPEYEWNMWEKVQQNPIVAPQHNRPWATPSSLYWNLLMPWVEGRPNKRWMLTHGTDLLPRPMLARMF